MSDTIISLAPYIGFVPVILGIITAILLIIWLYLVFAPGPRADRAPEPPQPQPQAVPPLPVENDDTIIDRVAGPASITIQSGLPNPGTMPLPGTEFRIGRFESPEVTMSLDEKTVSRNHAQVRANPQTGEYTLEDLGSSFGTFIVQHTGTTTPVPQGQVVPLTDGMVVQFGQAVRVRFNIPGAGEGHSTTPLPTVDNDPYKTQF